MGRDFSGLIRRFLLSGFAECVASKTPKGNDIGCRKEFRHRQQFNVIHVTSGGIRRIAQSAPQPGQRRTEFGFAW
ncbi:MAG TPA: hypothetical protein VFL67_01525 [Mycobacterium sp.]|nr:hypothetical protein [Mycobacterium sp.]